jgi:hypothetical protein
MMIGYKTGLACTLAAISPLVAAIAGWLWGVVYGGPAASRSGLCDGCGYDLTGNVSGICPECGLAISRQGEQEIEIHLPAPRPALSTRKAIPDPGPVTASHASRAEAAVRRKRDAGELVESGVAPCKPFSEEEIKVI